MTQPFHEREIWSRITASPAVREQQVAFTCATGVPLALLPASVLAHGLDEAFCVKGCLGDPSGNICGRRLLKAEKRAISQDGPVQYSCPSGLVKILVPVFINSKHAGSLLAGPFALKSLDGEKLGTLVDRLGKLGLGDRVNELRTTWRYTPLLSSEKCRAAGTLLRMFGRYLEETGKSELAAPKAPRSPLLEKIENLLAESQDTPVSLKEVAARVNLSPCHFCSVFKKQTGVTFSQYRTRQRLERARTLLQNPEYRVSDVAFEAGFQSIPYFNRAFRREFGCSPTEFRARLTERNSGQANRNPSVAGDVEAGLNHTKMEKSRNSRISSADAPLTAKGAYL